MAVEQRIGRIHRYGQTETVQVYHLVAEETIEEKVYAILEEKLFEIALTIGKVDSVTGDVSEDFRSEILGFLGSSTNYTTLYKEALMHRNYKRTEQEIAEAIQVATDASEALRQLTLDLSTFNLEYYRELEGNFVLEDLKRFTEKAILRLGGSFIPSGNLIQITVPPTLRKYQDVASRYENVTFSRKTATRKRNVDLLGIGHPLIDALLDFYKSESVSGELLNVKCGIAASCLSIRYLFTIEFEDGARHELYQGFLIDGEEELSDLDFLLKEDFIDNGPVVPLSLIEDKLNMLTRNHEAKIRSNHEGVVNIRHKCIGIQAVNCELGPNFNQ